MAFIANIIANIVIILYIYFSGFKLLNEPISLTVFLIEQLVVSLELCPQPISR